MATKRQGQVAKIRSFYNKVRKNGSKVIDEMTDEQVRSMADSIYSVFEKRLPYLKNNEITRPIQATGNMEYLMKDYESGKNTPAERTIFTAFINQSKEAFIGRKADYYTMSGALNKIRMWGVKTDSNGNPIKKNGKYVRESWAQGKSLAELVMAREILGGIIKENRDLVKIYGSDPAMDAIMFRLLRGESYRDIHDNVLKDISEAVAKDVDGKYAARRKEIEESKLRDENEEGDYSTILRR